MAEKYGVKMKKPGEVTLESEFEKIKKVRGDMFTSNESNFRFRASYEVVFFACLYYL
jgi:hypothetical protein